MQKQHTMEKFSSIATNKVLKNTYILLSLTLLFSSFIAGLSIISNSSPTNIWLTLIIMIGFPFLLQATKNSIWGIFFTFLYTGFIGWYIGPLLNFYIKNFTNGSELIMMSLGSTGLIFLVLSTISMNTDYNFSNWSRFLTVGIIIAFISSLINVIFFKIPMLQMVISVLFSLISGGLIMYQTNEIVRGGERNYIVATVTLFVSLINIFLTILQLLGMFSTNSSRD